LAHPAQPGENTATVPGDIPARREDQASLAPATTVPEARPCWHVAVSANWDMFNTGFLFASLIWGAIGLGYFIYGKRQGSWAPMIGGVAMMALSYFVGSVLLMSLLCAGIMFGVYLLLKG
jgi:hypothetical protein